MFGPPEPPLRGAVATEADFGCTEHPAASAADALAWRNRRRPRNPISGLQLPRSLLHEEYIPRLLI